jgi:membrane protein DedA with SNARE-associated domain
MGRQIQGETLATEPTGSDAAWRKQRALDVLCIGPMVLLMLFHMFGGGLTPALLSQSNPVLLELLRGTTLSEITAGAFAHAGRVPLVVALLAPLPASIIGDPFLFWAGRRYGRKMIEFFVQGEAKNEKRLRRAESWLLRFGFWAIMLVSFIGYVPLLGFVPGYFLFMLAGEARMKFWVFMVADAIGTVAGIGLYVGAGWLLGQNAVNFADWAAKWLSHIPFWAYLALPIAIFVVTFVVLLTKEIIKQKRASR